LLWEHLTALTISDFWFSNVEMRDKVKKRDDTGITLDVYRKIFSGGLMVQGMRVIILLSIPQSLGIGFASVKLSSIQV